MLVSMGVKVGDIAEAFQISPRRVRSLIAQGDIPAKKESGRWDIDAANLNRFRPIARPMSNRIGLALAQIFDAESDEIRADERYRLRRKLEKLPESGEPARLVASWLQNRGDRIRFWCDDPSRLRNDSRIVLSGVCDPRASLTMSNFIEGYVSQDNLQDIEIEYALFNASKIRKPANVILHIADLEKVYTLYLVADLAEYGEGRELDVANRIVEGRLC